MTSIPVKDIGAVMTRTATSGTTATSQSANTASFESVLSNQTEKNSSPEPATEETRAVRKEDDSITRDSLQTKDAHKSVVKESDAVDEAPKEDIRNMSPEEWDKAMEVLSAATVEMMQQVADAFGMTVEEVQGLMSELGMQPVDILQQENLGQLILAAGGADGAASLLTDENLYQQYQTLMEQLEGVLEETGEALPFDAKQLIQTVTQRDELVAKTPVIEVTVEEATATEDGTVVQDEELPQESTEDIPEEVVAGRQEAVNGGLKTEGQNNPSMMNGNQAGEQNLEQGKQTEVKQTAGESRPQMENLVLQNLKNESLEPRLQQLTQNVSAWDADTLDIMKQVMDYMKIQIKPDVSNLEMQLHPASLGTLQVHVASKGGNVTAQFVTQNEAVKAALESQMIQLKESFAEQGVKVDAIEVTVQTHQFEQNLEQGRGRQQNETERRTRTRRIQLDGALSLDDLSVMEEEEQLAAEMMAANGNTVDYTA